MTTTTTNTTQMVDLLFDRLAATYGAAWDRSLGQTPIADIKTVWANALDWQMRNKESRKAITWALANLPEYPPNVIQFRALCRQAPEPEAPRLEAPQADRELADSELGKAAEICKRPATYDHFGWARAIMQREQAGERLNPNTLACARSALGIAARREAPHAGNV